MLWWGSTCCWYTRNTRAMERRRWGLVTLPGWTTVRGFSLARWIISLIMVMMVPATLAHVAVATGGFEKKIGVRSFHFFCLPSRTRSKSQLLYTKDGE